MGSIVAHSSDHCYAIRSLCEFGIYNGHHGCFCRCQSHTWPSVSIPCKLNLELRLFLMFQNNSEFFSQEIHVTDAGGRSVILSFVINAFVGALALRFIVGRTKLCLDFTCTYHFVHLFICWVYNGTFPSTFSWWFLNAVCATMMCVCSEFLCLRIELKEIPVGYTPLDTKADLWNDQLP